MASCGAGRKSTDDQMYARYLRSMHSRVLGRIVTAKAPRHQVQKKTTISGPNLVPWWLSLFFGVLRQHAHFARIAVDPHRASYFLFPFEAARRRFHQVGRDGHDARDGLFVREGSDFEIALYDPIGRFARRQLARLAHRVGPSMLHSVPHVAERLVTLLDLQRQEFLLQFLHRAVECSSPLGLRVARSQFE